MLMTKNKQQTSSPAARGTGPAVHSQPTSSQSICARAELAATNASETEDEGPVFTLNLLSSGHFHFITTANRSSSVFAALVATMATKLSCAW
jgi:hypothetical protein